MRDKRRHPAMRELTDHEIIAALADRGDTILPSSGFLEAVMAEVQREAATPQAIGFPWKRALPGLVATTVVLLTLLLATMQAVRSPALPAASSPWLLAVSLAAAEMLREPAVLWPLVAAAVVSICLAGSRRLAGVR